MSEEGSKLTVEKLRAAKRMLQSQDIPDEAFLFFCPCCKVSITMLHVNCPNCGVQLK